MRKWGRLEFAQLDAGKHWYNKTPDNLGATLATELRQQGEISLMAD